MILDVALVTFELTTLEAVYLILGKKAIVGHVCMQLMVSVLSHWLDLGTAPLASQLIIKMEL